MNMLRHFLKDFMTFVPLQLPQLLAVTTMEEPQKEQQQEKAEKKENLDQEE